LAIVCFGFVLAGLTVLSAVSRQTSSTPGAAPLPPAAPAPADNPATPEKIALGKQLFFDSRLSGDNKMSCAACHMPEKAFTDGRPKARGAAGKELSRNTLSLLNVGFRTTYFWDGRTGTLEEQALVPIRSPEEMNQDLGQLEKELNAVSGYVEEFQNVFGTPVTREGIAKALAAFERTIVTRNSPFDRYLAGDASALSEEARQGWGLFRDADCIRCHNGPTFSDGEFYRLGPAFGDKGRGAITGRKDDLYAFRTPGLRDVARTAPYMHDGSFETLDQVVAFYYRQTPGRPPMGLPLAIEPLLGRSFSEIPLIIAFLEALSGELSQVTAPELP
jgi:cytochrome c peroxidase